MKKVLLCGHRSFVASGIEKCFEAKGIEYDFFSRGEEKRNGCVVTGNILKMNENTYLDTYETVVNFIIIKNKSVEENIDYIKALIAFCKKSGIKHLVQISSISVYPADIDYVDETTPIEKNPNKKGGYGSIKVAVDQYFLSHNLPFEVIFVRPGFIISNEKTLSMAGIIMRLPIIGGLLMGDANTSLPLVDKKKIHEAVVKIIESEKKQPVYLLLENLNGTKVDFAKKYYRGHVFKLPKTLTLTVSSILNAVGVFKARHIEQVKGLFKYTYYDSSETEYQLQMSFAENSVAVLGAGTYGAYIINALESEEKKSKITLFDIGDDSLKDEDGIGIGSRLFGASYTGLKKARFFGYGGASCKWGGQLLMFSENDFAHPTEFMKGIVRLNYKYRNMVFKKFGIKNDFVENQLKGGLFTKTGIWLGYFNRNLFKFFNIKESSAFIRNNMRISRLLMDEKKQSILGLELVTPDGKIKHAYHDQYFLTAGAFESNRIALSSGLVEKNELPFSDHLSQRIYKVKGSTVISGEDYKFGVVGTSMVTKRIIGEIGDTSFFANPIYNDEFPFFQNLKEIMFKGNFSLSVIKAVLKDIPSIVAFVWCMIVRHSIYAYKGEWKFFIDIENPSKYPRIKLSDEKDKWGIHKLDVYYEIPQEAIDVFNNARIQLKKYLDDNNVKYESIVGDIHADKSEDTYHPYGMFLSDCSSVEDYFTKYSNLLVVNTGVLPRAGGINTTAACLPLVEEYIAEYYGKR